MRAKAADGGVAIEENILSHSSRSRTELTGRSHKFRVFLALFLYIFERNVEIPSITLKTININFLWDFLFEWEIPFHFF